MSDDDISELKQRDISMHAETEKIVEPGTLMTIKSTLHFMISALKNIQKMKIPKRHIIGPHRNSAQKFLSLM